MKQAIFVGTALGIMVAVISGGVAFFKAASDQWERNEQTFRKACAEVNGVTVWNNKYWECLK